MPKYKITATVPVELVFDFDTSSYYDVDSGRPNFDPNDVDSVAEYVLTNLLQDRFWLADELKVKDYSILAARLDTGNIVMRVQEPVEQPK